MLNFNVTNISNVGREIYVWHRVGKTLCLYKDNTFFPYFYQVAPNGIFNTIDGKKVNKVICSRPSDVKNRRDENSYEADILFYKRYILDKISSFGKAELKYSFADIEVLCPELPNYLSPKYPISCISCSNSYTGEIKTFFIKDYMEPIDNNPGKFYSIEESEKWLLDDFVNWIKEQQFDLILGYNFIEFDWKYLRARYKYIFKYELAEILSPIDQAKYLGSSKQEEEPNLIPAGLSVCDYYDFYKKIYKTESDYSLDAVCFKELKVPIREKIDFNKLGEDIKIKNREDVRLLIELDKSKKLINYYDELRRMSMCDFSDVTWNSKMLDMILLREAKQKGIILPTHHYGQDQIEVIDEIGFEGAYRRCNIMDKLEEKKILKKYTGFHKNVWKLDLSSAYPMAIINFCLDISNIKNEGLDINGIKFYQNPSALLPTIAQKMISRKDTLKKQLKALNPESEEAKDLQIKYDAIKAVVNSLFGVCGLKIFRLFDYRVASSITYLVRDLLHYVETHLIELGMEIIYIDTDSFFILAKDNPLELCNKLIKQWAKEKYNKDQIGIEFDCEGVFEKLFIIALCHYKGYLSTPKGVKEESKGIEAKRKDSSNFIREFQTKLIDKIMNEEPQEEIVKFINSEKERIKTLSLIDIGFPCRINADKIYKSIPVFMRALEYTKELLPTFEKRPGDHFYWIPVVPFGTAMRKSSRNKTNKDTGEKELQSSEKQVNKDVLCYDEDNQAHIKEINWEKVIDKSILDKCEHIFEALGWDISTIKEIKIKKLRKRTKEDDKFINNICNKAKELGYKQIDVETGTISEIDNKKFIEQDKERRKADRQKKEEER
jgi:DNA polymerase elongation subunit (family B)